MKTVFVRPEKCIGCRHCEAACAVEHSQTQNLFEMLKEKPVSRPRIHVENGLNFLTFPNRCRHCDPAPCMQVCPADALYRNEANDSVLINYNKCIGCEACAIACPFGIIEFHNVYQVDLPRNVNAKCDNCIDRQNQNIEPACVEACKTGALVYGEINDLIRNDRKDFTIRILQSSTSDIEISGVPDNIKTYRNIMKQVAEMSPLQ